MASDPSPHDTLPHNSILHDSDHWYRLGAAALSQDDLPRAEAALWSCLAGDGQHAAALHLLGRLRERQGNRPAALALQLRSWHLSPGLGWNAFAAAELLSDEQRWEEAAAAYRAALKALPAETWIAPLLHRHEDLALFGAERLAAGFSDTAYQGWCRGFEPPLPGTAERPDQLPPDWCLEQSPQAVLRPGALAWLRGWLAAEGDAADLLTCDEDRLDAAGRRHDPWFKPGWVPESFWSTPWLGSGAFWRCSWLQRHGLWPPPTRRDGIGRWQWQLRALEHRPRVAHLPRILLHRRAGGDAAPAEAMADALAGHLRRLGEGSVAVRPASATPATSDAAAVKGAATADGTGAGDGSDPGFQLCWATPASWRLSVVVLSRDRPDLLRRCLHSVEASRGGVDLEWIVVDNGSRLEATAALLRHWRHRPGSRVRVLPLDQPFNWSLLNNRAAATSRAELLLFCNNDVEVPAETTTRGWLTVMAAQALRPAIGCVGARLLYPDGSLQHAGLLPPLGQGCEHPYRHLSLTRLPHRGRADHLSGWPAVTGACLMVRRTLWWRSGGFDPALPVEGNDVDFCLRLGSAGLRHVVCPEATLLHHEGASRDLAGSATWAPAQALLRRRWPEGMAQADPWWPQACSLETTDGRPRELAGRGSP